MMTNPIKTHLQQLHGPSKHLRRFLLVTGISAGCFAALLGTLPFWMGSILHWVLPVYGVEVADYHRLGYSRFVLTDLKIDRSSATVSISEAEAYTPLVWFCKHLQLHQEESIETPFVAIREVEVLVHDDDDDAPDAVDEPGGMRKTVARLHRIANQLQRWSPTAKVEKVVVVDSGWQFRFTQLALQDQKLKGVVEGMPSVWPGLEKLALELTLGQGESSDPLLLLRLQQPDSNAEFLSMRLISDTPHAPAFSVEGVFDGNRCVGTVQWGADGWVPEQAELQVTTLSINPQLWYSKFPVSHITGSLSCTWSQSNYSVEAQLNFPESTGSASLLLNDATMAFSARGDLDRIQIDHLNLRSSACELEQYEAISYEFETGLLSGSAESHVDLDLTQLGWSEISGQLTGTLLLHPDQDAVHSSLSMELRSKDCAFFGIQLDSLSIVGSTDFDTLEVSSLEATGVQGSEMTASLVYNISDRRVHDIRLDGDLASEVFAAYTPTSLQSNRIRFHVTGAGPLDQPEYAGEISISGIQVKPLHPLDAFAVFEGTLQGLKISRLEVENNQGSTLSLTGDFEWDERFFARLQSLQISNPVTSGTEDLQPHWQLVQPVEIAMETEDRVSGKPSSLTITPLQLRDGEKQLDLSVQFQNGTPTDAYLAAKHVQPGKLLQSWIGQQIPDLTIHELELNLASVGGFLQMNGKVDAGLHLDTADVKARGALQWNADGITLAPLEISAGNRPWITVNGTLPYAVAIERSTFTLIPVQDRELSLQVQTAHSEEWLPWVQPFLPVSLEEANVSAQLSGNLREPAARMHAYVRSQAESKGFGIPAAVLESDIQVSGTEIRLEPIRISMDAQQLELHGTVTLPDASLDWLQLQPTPIPWERVDYAITTSRSDLAPLAYFFPEIFRPLGTLQLELKGSLAAEMNGSLQLDGLSTRAIFPFGALHELHGALELKGKRAALTGFSGNIGRAPIAGTGWIDFSQASDPQYEFSMQGADIPIVRRAGVLLRTDLDLEITKQSQLNARLAGKLNLKNGVFLADLTELFGKSAGGRGVKSRPPYFAVETDPFSGWQLDIKLTGDHFMKIQTPVLTGSLSIDMGLSGTLGDPFAFGRAWFDEGKLKFPFAVFELESGVVQLNRDDPYTPVLDVRAVSSRLNYQLQLNVSGSAEDPSVNFTSSPALTPDQILFMVVAGEDPTGTLEYSGAQKASKIGSFISSGLFGSFYNRDSGLLSRLMMQWGNKLSERGRETVDLEFYLNDSFQLLGEYDEYDNWNGGIRWRVLNPQLIRNQSLADEGDELSDE